MIGGAVSGDDLPPPTPDTDPPPTRSRPSLAILLRNGRTSEMIIRQANANVGPLDSRRCAAWNGS
jgi:hypothetical protein